MKKTLFIFVAVAMSFFACTNGNNNTAVQNGDNNTDATETVTVDVPDDALVTDQSADGNQVLYLTYTEQDLAYNKENFDPEMPDVHNTLFLLDKKNGTTKMLMTMSDDLPGQCFSCDIQEAWFSKDGSRVFIINNPNTGTYFNALLYDLKADKLIYLSDGDGIAEGDDGLYYVANAKGYNWEEGGAFWFTRIVDQEGNSLGGRDTIY